MSEAAWADAAVPRLLQLVGRRLSVRKVRLLSCACVRHALRGQRKGYAEVLALAERHADGQATNHELAAARFTGRFLPGHPAWAVCWPSGADATLMLERALAWLEGRFQVESRTGLNSVEEREHANLFREVVPSPFHPLVIEPHWLAWGDGLVPALARQIYDMHAFERLPYLGDALEEAGCADERLLGHLRQGEGHVRGCWALDALLALE